MTESEQAGTRTRPRRGEEFELEVETLVYGGRGLGRRNGFVVFVDGGLPGDRVLARVSKSKKGYAEASTVELIERSSGRLPDEDVHDGEPCPGAPWQALPYDRQLAFKAEQVADALSRIGRLEDFELEPITAADALWRYRNKVEYSFGDQAEETVLGFRPRGRWDEVLEIEDCLLSPEATNRARNELLGWARGEGIPPFDPRTGEGVLRNLVVRESFGTGQVQTRLVTSPARISKPPVDLHTVVEGPGGGTIGPTGVIGDEFLIERVSGLEIRLSHESFFQTNTAMAEVLYGTVREFLGDTGGVRLFDLFCGAGTIGLVLADLFDEVVGLEIVPDAVANAEWNARANGIRNARFVEADTRTGLRPLIAEVGKPDVVVVDPPRAGLSAKVTRRLIECEAERIVYVSCNPTTLAPNAAQLVEAGYRLVRVRPVDMFPQTPHIECVALFVRDEAGGIGDGA